MTLHLIPREQEILDWIWAGHETPEIARALHISPRTVEVYRINLRGKLKATNTAQLIRAALEAGLIQWRTR